MRLVWDWVEPFLQYGWGPVVAAAAVLWNQTRTDRREERRRASELAEDAKRRAEDRQLTLQERWRDDRRAIYSRGLATIDAFRAAISDIHTGVTRSGGLEMDDSQLEKFIRLVEELREVLAELSLIGSKRTQSAADTVANIRRTVSVNVILLSMPGVGERDRDRLLAAVTADNGALASAREEYLNAARADLETD